MKSYQKLQHIFYQNVENHCYGVQKEKAFFHSIQVSILSQQFAQAQGLNPEIAAIAGLFHDYSQYLFQNTFHHAQKSCELLSKFLPETELSKQECELVIQAIANHSRKDSCDDEYSELLKDADVLSQYYMEPSRIFEPSSQQRIEKHLSKY